jgi:hypothetical protein
MPKQFISFAVVILLLTASPIITTVHAEWPARVFAPYMYLGSGDDFKLTDCDDACGLKYYTLAFIIARQDGNGKDRTHEPAWNGRSPWTRTTRTRSTRSANGAET